MAAPELPETASDAKRLHDALNHAAKLVEQSQNRFVLDNPRFVERYCAHELCIVAHLFKRGLRERDKSTRDYLAVFYGVKSLQPYVGNSPFFPQSVDETGSGSQTTFGHAADQQQERLVFLAYVEAVKHPQQVVPALVWFGRSVDVLRRLPRALYWSSVSGLKTFGGVHNVEAAIRILRDPQRVTVNDIECRTKLVDGIACNRCNPGEVLSDNEIVDEPDALPAVVIVLENDAVGVQILEVGDSAFQVAEMLLGPLDLNVTGKLPLPHDTGPLGGEGDI